MTYDYSDISNCRPFADQPFADESSTTLVDHPHTLDSLQQDPSDGTMATLSGGSLSGSVSSGSVFSVSEGGVSTLSEAAQATTPPIVTQLTDMGFLRQQVNIALNR